jgi:CopG family nickel-responsive transcriptional regulator
MTNVLRFSVSLEEDLLQRFDEFCQEQKFATRSEAVRQLIHEGLVNRAKSRER